MLVCPQCRHANDEESTICASCGRTLTPDQMFLGGRREGVRTPIEINPPKPPPWWVPWAVIAGIGGIALGVFVIRHAVNPCREANFTSEDFGYCLTYPEGWVADAARIGDGRVDQFQTPDESTTVFVEAVDLASDTDLPAFVEAVRQRDEDAGLSPGPVSDASLDDRAARLWDVTVDPAGGTPYRMREVVTVVGEIGWRITLSGSEDDFQGSLSTFGVMLDSWRFR